MIIASAGLGQSSVRAIVAFGDVADKSSGALVVAWTGEGLALRAAPFGKVLASALPGAHFALGVDRGHLSLADEGDAAASVLALALCGRIENFRALKRRLIAAGKSGADASESDVVRDLFTLYRARGRGVADALRAALALLVGDIAVAALVRSEEGLVIATAARGKQGLFVGSGASECALSTDPTLIACAGFASNRRAGDGDCALLRSNSLAFVDEDDMIIERCLAPMVQASAGADQATDNSATVFV